MVKISVIVPVYNASSTLNRCVDSILNQTFSDFELLLINDGSKDHSGQLCDEYAKKDPRVRVFHKENGGVSSARNLGLDNATGEWISFCDSDDEFDLDFLKSIYQYSQHDVILTSFITKPNNRICLFPNHTYTESKEIGQCLKEHIYTGFSMPWAKLYKRQIITENKLYFNTDISSGEDTLWVSQYLMHINSIVLLDYQGYIYYKQNGLSEKGLSESAFLKTIELITETYSNLEKQYFTDLSEWKLNVQMYFFHRYVVLLSNSSLFNIRSKLNEYHKNRWTKNMFYDEVYVLKGLRLKLFNYLMRNQLYLCLSFYVKLQKRYL